MKLIRCSFCPKKYEASWQRKNNRCPDCKRRRRAERHQANKTRENLQAKAWYRRNASEHKAKTAAWTREHPEKKALYDRRYMDRARREANELVQSLPFGEIAKKIGIREAMELQSDLLGGEASAEQLAERYRVSERTIQRERATLRRQGLRVPTPEAWEAAA